MDFFKPYIKNYCYCGSGKQYNVCCKKFPYKPNYDSKLFEQFELIFQKTGRTPKYLFDVLIEKCRIEECLCLGCNSQSIKSHLIGKSILKKAFNATHIKAFGVNDDGISFKKVGVNDATTFYIWCSKHDTEIFKNIDEYGFVINSENLVLLVLRALGNETRKKQFQIRMNYNGMVINDYRPDPYYNPFQLVGCYQGYLDVIERYRIVEHYLNTKKYDKTHSYIFELPKVNTIFVSSVFQMDIDLDGTIINETDKIDGQMVPLILNIFTQNGKNYIVFSFVNKDLKIYSKFIQKLNNLFNNDSETFKTIINNLLHYFSENIFIGTDFETPKDYEFLSPYEFKKKEVNYFCEPPIKYII